MPSLLSRSQHDVAARSSLTTLPLALFLASVLASIATSTKHALLTSAIAWVALCTIASLRVRSRSLLDFSPSQRLAWSAGAVLALSQVCERAVDGKGIWWAKAVLPLLLHASVKAGIFEGNDTRTQSPPVSPTKIGHTSSLHGSSNLLVIVTLSGLVAVYAHSGSISVIAIGLSYSVLQAVAFRLIERARDVFQSQTQAGGGVIYSANGLLAQPTKQSISGEEQWTSLVRDVAFAAAVCTAIAALSLETMRFGGLAYYGIVGQLLGDNWVFGQAILSIVFALLTTAAHMILFGTLLLMIQQQGAFLTSFVPLAAALSSQLLWAFSLSRLWFAAICTTALFSFLDEHDSFASNSRMKLRITRLLTVTAIVSFVLFTFYYLQQPIRSATLGAPRPLPTSGLGTTAPATPLEPLRPSTDRIHPIKALSQDAQASWDSKLKSQSQTLDAAVTEYRRRYGMPPPPHFDKWYEFAKRRRVQLIDEYDSIYHSLLPFWALSPAMIRGRAREAIGYGDNMMMGLMIRDGQAKHVQGGPEWLQQAAVGMMEQFLDVLPDMDLAFNTHDEPRVVVPHDELSRMVDVALQKSIPIAAAQKTPKNKFSARPKDVTGGLRLPDIKTTRFNVFAHQPVWLPSRLSCPPDSPARAPIESNASDNLTAYALGELGFVYNQSAFSDVCNAPSLGHSHGFFDRPNAFNIVHDLFPVFSQSKMSSFQDILFPSPWYWYGKVQYKEASDLDWAKKTNTFWWRGSTTGGFSRDGGWKRQHRQQFVRKVNALDTAKVLTNSKASATDEDPNASKWIVKEVPRQDFKELIDVYFSHVGQCDPGDCDAQKEFFEIVEPADQQDAWKQKYLLDIDGNAFSGRFYAFLKSHSLPFKMAVFREWHADWIQPWVHYIPLSLKADEVLEAVRYFDAENEGRSMAVTIAEAGRDWANKALRNEDFEVWLFRLMLEYGRVIDDNRDSIGYSGS